MGKYDELIERLDKLEPASDRYYMYDVAEEAAQALRDLQRAYRPPDMVDYNKAMARIEELEEIAQFGQGYDGEGHYGPYGNHCMNIGQFDAGTCWLCQIQRQKTRIEELECHLAISKGKHENCIAEIELLKTALRSIAANTCCDKCQEAAKVAREALDKEGGA